MTKDKNCFSMQFSCNRILAQVTRPTFSLIVIIIIALSASVCKSLDLTTLRHVQIIFRHGDRTPEYAYPKDPFQSEDTWPEGWGQLTQEGKLQEYKLGQYLRSRYKSFISNVYKPSEIYMLSSDLDRTIMSGELCLTGLFPVTNLNSNWNSNITWQPVPLRTIPKKDDNLIRMKKDCPRFQALLQDFLANSTEMKEINDAYKDLYEYWSQKSGVEIDDIRDIDGFYATLLVEHNKGLQVPKWTLPLFNSTEFQYLYNLSFQVPTYTTELKRLRAGPLVQLLSSNVENVTKTRRESQENKMVLISAHDVTMVDIMNTFGVYSMQIPPYASAFIIETHEKSTDGSFYLNLLFHNDTSKEPYELNVNGEMPFNWNVNDFFTFVKPLIPEDWDAECQIGNGSVQMSTRQSGWSWHITSSIAGAVILLGLVTIVAILVFRKKRKNKLQRRSTKTRWEYHSV